MTAENLDLLPVLDFVDELARAGVRDVCVSPGSRSTPLTMAFARHGGFQLYTLLDERSAGFFALGLAKAKRRPAVLVCTSGTAAANYLPAVVEAYEARVPLVVLTADRPPELYGTGSNQTVDQVKLYGTHVKLFLQMPVPMAEPGLRRQAAASAWRLVHTAWAAPAGPVHANWPFREPLVPPRESAPVRGGLAGHRPGAPEAVYAAVSTPDPEAITRVASRLAEARRAVVVCGPWDDPAVAPAVASLAAHWDVPILADPLSQVRVGRHDLGRVIDTYDTLLRGPSAGRIRPDLVIRIGHPPVSKALGQWLGRHEDAFQVVVDVGDRWRDPFFSAGLVVQADPVAVCRALAEAHAAVHRPAEAVAAQAAWSAAWREADLRARRAMDAALEAADDLFEGRVWTELAPLLPDGSTVFAGNSMPVRDLDSFLGKRPQALRVYGNRGASGIDGVVSTAAGVAAAGEKTVLVIGDVSFYHDLGGLLAATRHGADLVVVVIHNDGGGIFSFLPQAEHQDTFIHFRTPHGLTFQGAVEMYGARFTRASDWPSFRRAVAEGLDEGGVHVVLVPSADVDNVGLHRRVFERAWSAVEGVVWPS
ncbi:2-succinyl-5-enolpyruvyl-6-hydroxy-3-cyclohexene-1-carboxylic-acid synthase [Alicyclobacillus macrosporangiidus]|uniref:2-succinyl-5-enolpyruvyl-6-hydroxy-3- cyclohexene-1-carboxylic-acid synthase n=1 Tax=Alicyclobacillus macrosporangiidus TaxID=392015 RepID=UPI000497D21E|nr:2-succinyl-5-enolpyruvyl-6-hydroxy-3-cyclohexene-1-carboxylic-acid synthase [Alicyclobacillus macrosporangiidus]